MSPLDSPHEGAVRRRIKILMSSEELNFKSKKRKEKLKKTNDREKIKNMKKSKENVTSTIPMPNIPNSVGQTSSKNRKGRDLLLIS